MPLSLRLISPFCTCLCLGLLIFTGLFFRLSDTTLDLFFAVRGPVATSQSVVIVGIDEASLQTLGPWPFPRSLHAKLLQKLHMAESVGFDFLFIQDGRGDNNFQKAFLESPPVALAVAHNYDGTLLMVADSLRKNISLGHIETHLGSGGVVRTVELRRGQLPVLALAMLPLEKRLKLGLENRDASRIINFYGSEFSFLYISYADVLAAKVSSEFFRDRYVLVGSQAVALGDVHVTPLSKKHPVPGVEIQATILNNLLDGSFIDSLPVVSYGVAAFIIISAFFFWPKGRESRNLLVGFLVIIGVLLVSYQLFRCNLYIDPSPTLVLFFIAYFIHLIVQGVWLAQKLFIEIKVLDKKLEEGAQHVFKTIPSKLVRERIGAAKGQLTGGLHRHIEKIHDGIQALALQNQFINHLLCVETPPLVIWERSGGQLVLVNERFRDLWGRIMGENVILPNLSTFNKMLEEKEDGATKPLSQSSPMEDSKCINVVDVLFRVNGRKTYHRIVVYEMKNSLLGFSGILASFTDVTEIRELEKIKGEMMNIVSHELKLPLTTIMGYGEMLSLSLKDDNRKYADEICNQAKRLAKMIEDFLDIARMENGKFVINRYPYDFLTVVHDAASGVQNYSQKKGIKINYDLPVKLSPLLGDEVLITQAILNLLDNAVKFSPENSNIYLKVKEEKDNIVLYVSDEGPGVCEAEKEIIFDKFVRSSGQVSESGFGLGLSFVSQVVAGHGGAVHVCNRHLVGAEFSLVLPKAGLNIAQ